ncbi:hypothetical protein PHAVU_002G130600 [Phaseolus vulgaris]|uniref:Uncharacterized protein n=1 Tax=Phaseolus vulgaris TaxID=3885 RepID=V7CLQ9_PHAVU|nr:hypothetical protein PHAVU_002G130600g [Phaseolus vulgaris]ESW30170.1 hypothetical protein PHAVU_002G130600g [Phaseolus vulgaris]
MADALLGTVIQNLQSAVKDQLTTYWVHTVKNWLQKLTDATYVLDDILDECSLQSKKVLSDDGRSSCLARVHFRDILFRFHIGKRMKDITQRFHDINEERRMFELRDDGVTEKQALDDDDDGYWRPTSSDITEPRVYGRDEDREQIVKFLLEDASNSEDLSVFNDHRVCNHFDLTIWVCVSDDFNTMTILQSIIECCIGQNPNLNTLEAVRKKVEEVLQSKRYLLVLDDVWNEDQEKWKQLKGKLQCARAAKGATILVTTRLQEVVSTMETHGAYHLKELSRDDSWSLFTSHAFGPNRKGREELVAIGKEIVKKCVGSPLAIKTLGSLLRDESEVSQWENVKESEIWNICEENSIMRALKLSYSNLELSLRICFSFCAIFPKDFEIDKEDLIHLWMANGFIKSKGNVEVEDVGNKVWKKLYRRSIFQEAKYAKLGMIRSCKMHDLFHDLAQSIMGEECVIIENGRLTQLPTRVHYVSLSNSKKTAFKKTAFKKVESLRTFLDLGDIGLVPSTHCLRALCTTSYSVFPVKDLAHLRYLSWNWGSGKGLHKLICQLPKLQILKLQHLYHLRLPKELTQLQDLRHIVINNCYSISEMPPNIGKLRHLRTLSTFVVGSKLGCGLSELHSLKLGGTLRIEGLEKVPNEWDAKQANLIGKKDLNILDLSWGGSANSKGSNVNVERSFGMRGYQGRQLSSWMRSGPVLRDLGEVTLLNCDNCEELPPLGKLQQLKRLKVGGMKNVKWIDDESYDGVEEKAFPSLVELSLENLPKMERMLREEGVEMLPRLSLLRIGGISNLKFPRLPSVEKVSIFEAASLMEGVVENMPCLKTLHIIRGVVELHIISCDSLEYFSEHGLEGLTSLRSLIITNGEKLKSLSEGVRHLTCLESLSIMNCPELVTLPSNMTQLTALRTVRIHHCSTLPYGLQCAPPYELWIYSVTRSTSLPDWVGDMTSLQKLEIGYCEELRSIPSSIQRLTNLSSLNIRECPYLKKRCKRETGEDWQYIKHIPEIQLFFQMKPTFCGKFKSVLFTSLPNVSLCFSKIG